MIGETFLNVYYDLDNKGKLIAPRGMVVLELENYQFTLQPYERFTSFDARKLSLKYIKAELMWYLSGDKYSQLITEHAQIWTDLMQPTGEFFSNYGQYIFDEEHGINWVVNQLSADKDSRQAVILLLDNKHLFKGNKDVVCTYNMSFRIRDRKLNMSVSMRSNDAIWGMTNDVAAFSFMHEIVYVHLLKTYPDLELGEYTHKVDSLHVYERHFEMLSMLLLEGMDGYKHIEVPKISCVDEVKYLMKKARGHFVPPMGKYNFVNWVTSDE